MRRSVRSIAISAGAACVVATFMLAGALYTLQSTWFKNKVRERIIGQIEEVSGGRIELGSFDYDWRTITAEFRGLVVRGTEPGSAQPLFQADRVSVGLKVISIFKRDIDVASVVVRHPRIHVLVAPDGSTNIPTPRSGRVSLTAGVQALLNLKVRHFELDDGVIEADRRIMPLSVKGENTTLRLTYDNVGRRYDATFSSRELHVNSDSLRPFAGAFEATGRLQRDSLSIQSAIFNSRESTVHASGTLLHFAHPVADLRISADLDALDVTAITKMDNLGRGRLTLSGAAHYDENTPAVFQGKIAGRDVAYRIKSLNLGNVSVESDFIVQESNLQLTHLVVLALGSRFAGEMALRQGRDVQVDGTLSGLSFDAATALLSKQKLPWSGVAAGPVHLRAILNRNWRDLTVQSNLSIVPGRDRVPLSGNLDATYRAKGSVVEFRRSSLSSANTRLSFSGVAGASLDVVLDSTNLDDLNPLRQLLGLETRRLPLPTLARNGSAHFDGKVSGPLQNPQVAGNLALSVFQIQGQSWNQLRSHLVANEKGVDFSSLVVDQGLLHAVAEGHVGLDRWMVANNSALQLRGQFRGVDFLKLASSFSAPQLRSVRGTASGTFDLQGTVMNPSGTARMDVANVDAYGERLNQVELDAMFAGDTVQITRGHMQAGPAELSFSGAYTHAARSWREGQLQVKLDSNGFPLASLAPLHEYLPGVNAQFEIHGKGVARIGPDSMEPVSADGTAVLRNLTVNKVPYGSIRFNAGTQAQNLTTSFSGNLRGSRVTGSAQMQMTVSNPIVGQVHLDSMQLSTIAALIRPQQAKLPFEGLVEGSLTFKGPLQEIRKMHGTIAIEKLELTSNIPLPPSTATPAADLTFRNVSPILFQYADGVATVSRFEMRGRGTNVTVSGSVPFVQQRPMQLKVNGSINLQLFELFDPNVRASGESLVAASVSGAMAHPSLSGTLELKNGTFFASNLPNGLTAVNGTVRFDRDRATIEKLTAQTGGGELSMGGFMSFGNGGPLIYRLEANAENVRLRYAGSVSITATSQLRLTGTSENSILSGTATISRVIFNPNTDVGNLLASAAAPAASPSNEKDFLTGLQFDIHVESAPNLQLSTELSRDVEAEIDLRLRGTPERPVLLGNITANQGDIRVFGTKYTINRGEVDFVNAVKIEPALDLDLQTQARGITVDITVSGTPGKLNINYRSDPPLQPRDIIALLTVGRAPNITSNVPNASVTNDVSALQSGANTVLGQAVSPASNRLSKLFGITNIKIDPMVQGITNTPQARLTVEQQISRQITVTYVTNLSQTSEQIFRLEWAFSTHYSLVALRDDNGEFGIDIQYRKRFK